MKLPFFGDINPESLQDYYKAVINFEGSNLELDLNFENSSIDEKNLRQTANLLENLKESIDKVKGFINEDFQTGDAVDEYITFHLEELFEEDLDELLKDTDKTLSQREQFFSLLHLERIGFYPECENHHTVFDFVVNRDFSDNLLVVKLKENGELDHITMES